MCQEYALGCQSCLCSFKLIFGQWGLFVFKLGLVDSIHSKDGWQKLKWCSSHCIWLASTNVVSMYEVGYSWVLTLVVFTAFLDQDLWPQFFLRGFKFGSTSRCSFIQSGFWLDFWVLCLNNWIEQVEILSMYMQQSWEHLMLDQVSSVVSVLLHKYFYCSMVAERACSSGGQPSLDSPFWEQEKHSWAFWSIFWRIFTSWLHPWMKVVEMFWSWIHPLPWFGIPPCWTFVEEASIIYIPSTFIPHSKGLVPVTKLSNSSPCVHVAKAFNLLG